PDRRLDLRPHARERARGSRRAAPARCDGGPLMLRATLDQMRASAGRLAAAGIAILLGTAFGAASLLASATMEQATHDAFTASYADADLVVTARSEPLTSSSLADIRAIDGVKGADIESYFGLEIAGAGAAEYVGLAPTPSDPSL